MKKYRELHSQRLEDRPSTALNEAVLTHELLFTAEMALALDRPVKIEAVRTP
jgi:hypothetical protein